MKSWGDWRMKLRQRLEIAVLTQSCLEGEWCKKSCGDWKLKLWKRLEAEVHGGLPSLKSWWKFVHEVLEKPEVEFADKAGG